MTEHLEHENDDVLNINYIQHLSPELKNFIDKNKVLIIKYYLCCESENSAEEQKTLIYLKDKYELGIQADSVNTLNEIIDNTDNNCNDYNKTLSRSDDSASLILGNIITDSIYDFKRGRVRKTNTECPHYDKKHYAKNMCYNCYHVKGRDKRAWKCRHLNKMHYAKGLCMNCYHTLYKFSRPEVIENANFRAKLKKQSR